MSNLKTWPENVFLNADNDVCLERTPIYDIQYIRADLVDEQLKEARAKERARCVYALQQMYSQSDVEYCIEELESLGDEE